MSCNNEQPNKKRKKEVLNDRSGHHVPVILTDYGSSRCNNQYNSLVYLRAPEWQVSSIENEQLHAGVHPPIKSNASCFELLPNELIEDLFKYLPVMDLFRSFYYLNQRFHQLVQYHVTQQAGLRIDFSSLSLREFDLICSQFNPEQIEVLTLGDGGMNRINESSSFGQIALFLHRYQLSQFTSLKSLRIIEPSDDKQHLRLLNQLSENQLKHLWIRFRTRSQEDLLFCLPFMNTLQSLYLDQVTLRDPSKLSQMNFKQLQYFSVNGISIIVLVNLLSSMPRLRYLKIHNKLELNTLSTFYVESNGADWKAIELHLLSHMPNLHRLSLVGVYQTSVTLLAEEWKECFLTYTPHLTDFRFYIPLLLTDRLLPIDKILKPFQEEFWQARKWYAAVDAKEDENMHLYSLPCPRLYQPLEIITYAAHRLTTLPASLKISHMYYNSITSLDASCIDNSTQTYSTDILYSKVLSLIISPNDCDIILHHLIRLSSIRELTLIDNTNPACFINLLNMMLQLESLRLLKDSGKILLFLKENVTLMQCLRKRALRKLFLKNYSGVEDLSNKPVFPIDEFIQIFGPSLESLYWMKPPISVPVYSLINGLPKLKSLTTAWCSNMAFSIYKVSQWIQENTRLNTYVAKREYANWDVIWYFWL